MLMGSGPVCVCLCVGLRGCCCHILSVLWRFLPGGIPDSHLALIFFVTTLTHQLLHANNTHTHSLSLGCSRDEMRQLLLVWIITFWFELLCVVFPFTQFVLWKQSDLVFLVFHLRVNSSWYEYLLFHHLKAHRLRDYPSAPVLSIIIWAPADPSSLQSQWSQFENKPLIGTKIFQITFLLFLFFLKSP